MSLWFKGMLSALVLTRICILCLCYTLVLTFKIARGSGSIVFSVCLAMISSK
ncbi:hypothetical protein Hanom_Chr17g01535141 [Helianthus anomalus]